MQKIADETALAQATVPKSWKRALDALGGKNAEHIRNAIQEYLAKHKALPEPAKKTAY